AFTLDGDEAWQLPASLYGNQAAITLIANPNNPSSTLIPPEQLEELADSLPGLLVVDEAYVDFAAPGSSMLSRLQAHPNLVVLRTFSKSYSLAAARLGLLFGHPQLIAQLMKVKDSYNVGALSQAIGIAALGDRAHHEHLISATIAARVELSAALREFGWQHPPSHGNFLLMRVGEQAEGLYRGLKERGILVRWWPTPELRQRLRITVGQPAQNQRLIANLRELLP
ncbi:MAG: pyridoxal phosphate-dependent aminotransferase, partial [Planctomycetota bacterium]